MSSQPCATLQSSMEVHLSSVAQKQATGEGGDCVNGSGEDRDPLAAQHPSSKFQWGRMLPPIPIPTLQSLLQRVLFGKCSLAFQPVHAG